MKWILSIYICSFIEIECTPPIQSPIVYDSWYKCHSAALQKSIEIFSDLDKNLINNKQLGVQFSCLPLSSA